MISALEAEPRAELSFGDLCSAEIFFDAYLRGDASALRRDVVTGNYAEKKYGGEVPFYMPVNPENPALKAKQGEDYTLAHGVAYEEAVCLNDDCVIATQMGRDGGKPSGRLLFAPVAQFRAEEEKTLTRNNWRRQRLGGDRVIEVHRVFPVAAEDVATGLESGEISRQSLTPQPLADLAARWTAHAARRGLYVAASNAAKLATLVAKAKGAETAAAKNLGQAVATMTTASWRLEGHSLEGAGQEYDDHPGDLEHADADRSLAMLDEDLAALEEAVAAARRALTPLVAVHAES